MTWWRGRLASLAVVLLVTAGCGGDDGGGEPSGEQGEQETGSSFDGSWSGGTSDGGSIEFTVSNGLITAYRIESGEGVFGPDCSELMVANEGPSAEAEVPIEDDRFSWGGPGVGQPVEGTFDSDTTASGTASFSPDLVNGELPPGCQPNEATWEAVKEGAEPPEDQEAAGGGSTTTTEASEEPSPGEGGSLTPAEQAFLDAIDPLYVSEIYRSEAATIEAARTFCTDLEGADAHASGFDVMLTDPVTGLVVSITQISFARAAAEAFCPGLLGTLPQEPVTG